MCHEPTARPPLPPVAGGAGVAGTEELVLQAADGNRFNAFSATAVAPDAPGIMILPDVRGLHPFYKDLAVRFAEAGVHATAMDYFGRSAGLGERDDGFDFMSHVAKLTPDGVGADTAATVAHLRAAAFGGADPNIPVEAVERFRSALDEAGVPNEMVVYDGAPHSFDRSFGEHREACDDAW